MAIAVACSCGRRFDLKPEYAGRQVACPDCGATLDVPAIRGQADPAFDRDRFLLRQKRLAINQKYVVHDEQDQPILFVERPTYLFRSLLATFGVLLVIIAGTVVTLLVPTLLDERGHAIRNAAQTHTGQRLKAKLGEGELQVRVEDNHLTPVTLSLLD